MEMTRKLLDYLNPIAHLGERKYTYWFPFLVTISTVLLLELIAHFFLSNHRDIGIYAILFPVGLIIYFSFREGIIGGVIPTIITISYYFYLIFDLQYKGAEFSSSVDTTITLGILYFILAGIIGWLKETIDILLERETDEKQRLETIIQQLPVGVLVTDSKGRLMQENKQVERILGTKFSTEFIFGKDSFLEGKTNGKIVNVSQGPIAQALSSGKSTINKEYTVTRPDGKDRHLRINASVVKNKQGKVIAAAQIINDITQEKELEGRKEDFINMASHELKTPITSLKLYIDLLLRQIKEEKPIKTVKNIKQQTERLQELVNELLDVTRLQTGKLHITRESFVINTLLEDIIDALQGTAKNKRIDFENKRQVTVYGDQFRIYQVCTNLLTNAIKYSPENKNIIVNIKKEENKAIVSVQDFGIGIDKEQQKRIFDKLYQVSAPKEKTFPGLGMGLYISKEIIKQHRGRIWVESEKGAGSTFYFSIPLHK